MLACSRHYEDMATHLEEFVTGSVGFRTKLRDHGVERILEDHGAREAHALQELRVAKAKARRALAQLMRDSLDWPSPVAHWSIVQCDVDHAILQAEDKTIAGVLNHPTALFPVHSHHDCGTETYPSVMNHARSWRYEEAVRLVRDYRVVAFELLEALGLQGLTMEYVLALGEAFRCDSCPSGVGPLYGWKILVCPEIHVFRLDLIGAIQVRHYVQERRWHATHGRELEESGQTHNGGPVPWVNTHRFGRASLLADGYAQEQHRRYTQAVEVADEASPKDVCRYCPRPPPKHFPSEADTVQLASVPMSRRISIQHLRERYNTSIFLLCSTDFTIAI
jgi:hypothetical protein